MPANTIPIFSKAPIIQWGNAITAANTAVDGTGTTTLIYTAPADGGYVKGVRFQPLGTNVQTVARIFLNNGNDPAVAANNVLLGELTIPASTLSQTAALPIQELPLGMGIPGNYRLYATLGTAIAAGVRPCVYGGSY